MKNLVIASLILFIAGCSTTGFGTLAYKENADGKISIVPSTNPKYDYETRITDIEGYGFDDSLRQERDIMVATWSDGKCKVVDEKRENFVDAGSAMVSVIFTRGYVQHRYVSGVVCKETFDTSTKVVIIQ